MSYVEPTIRTAGHKVNETDWNRFSNNQIDHETRILALEAMVGSVDSGIPVGGIIMWTGAIVPADFAICDGTSGTPDLRDKFVIGAGNTYALGATGGATTHTHTMNDTGSGGSHGHSGSATTGTPSATTNALTGASSAAGSAHTHGVSLNIGSVSGHTHTNPSTNAGSSLPSYYAIYFIMRIA